MDYETGKNFERHEEQINFILKILVDAGLIKTQQEEQTEQVESKGDGHGENKKNGQAKKDEGNNPATKYG